MADYNSLYQQSLYLFPDQQDLLLDAPSSNSPSRSQQRKSSETRTESHNTPGHAPSSSFAASPAGVLNQSQNNAAAFGFGDDESSFLDFSPDIDFDFQDAENILGHLSGSLPPEGKSDESEQVDTPSEPREKRKDMEDGRPGNDNEESGKKRKESDEKAAKKPGRKPLTSEPTSVCNYVPRVFFFGGGGSLYILTNSLYRNARRRTARRSGHSVKGRRSI